jgi:hypothetical protein
MSAEKMKLFESLEFIIMLIVFVLCSIPIVFFGSMFEWLRKKTESKNAK